MKTADETLAAAIERARGATTVEELAAVERELGEAFSPFADGHTHAFSKAAQEVSNFARARAVELTRAAIEARAAKGAPAEVVLEELLRRVRGLEGSSLDGLAAVERDARAAWPKSARTFVSRAARKTVLGEIADRTSEIARAVKNRAWPEEGSS